CAARWPICGGDDRRAAVALHQHVESVPVARPSRLGGAASPLSAQAQEAIAGYLFILPSFVLYTAVVLVPLVATVYFSFTFYDRSGPPFFIGWGNYVTAFETPRFGQIRRNTLVFAIGSLIGNVGLGLALALLLNRAMPRVLLYLFRLAYFLPVIIAMSFVSIVWSFLYSTDLGVFTYYLQQLGLPRIGWLTDPRIALG